MDLDIVIREEELGFFTDLLEREGFKQTIGKEVGEIYKGEFIRFERGVLTVNVDLLVNMVQSRQTNAAYSFAGIPRLEK